MNIFQVARSSGFKLYESVTNQVDYNEYFQALNMPDTFYSWFLVTEVHVWMLMARVMNEGENGRWVRNAIVEAMWQDVEYRSKQLGVLQLLSLDQTHHSYIQKCFIFYRKPHPAYGGSKFKN